MIQLNGEPFNEKELKETCILGLIQYHEIAEQHIAVEKNGKIVPGEKYSTEPLVDGDRVEIIHFVGGG